MLQQKLVIETDAPVTYDQNYFSYAIVYTNLFTKLKCNTSVTVINSKTKYSATEEKQVL